MRRILKKAVIGAGVVGGASFGTAYYLFPEIRRDHHQLLKATERVMRLSWTGMRMAYIYGIKSNTMHEKHVEASKLLADAFINNGGIYIKIGQILATIDILAPVEYTEELSRLYQSAKPSTFESIRSQIEETFGQKLEDVFQSFNATPISSASIAQVHEAYLKSGEKVAVKVQHKWLKEQCQGDIRIVDSLIDIGEILFPDFKYKWFGDELKKYVPSELNFLREVENAEKTREFFKKYNNIRVPRFYHNYCNEKVILMEFIEGIPVNKAQEIKKLGVDLREVAKVLSHCFSLQVFKFGHVHADPHPGEYRNLFISAEKDANGVTRPILTLLDHGLYQTLNDEVRLQYSYLWKGILMRDEDLIKQAATDLGVGEWYPLLAAMVSRKKFDDIMNHEEKDYNKRLKLSHTQEEKDRLQRYAMQYSREITTVLHEINKDVILLFKTNHFLISITNGLGDPVNKYEILARYCLEAVEEEEYKNKNDKVSKFKLWWQKTTTLLGLRLYALYYTFASQFRKSAEIPDEILI